jgi:hypothetical protein
MKAEFIFTDCKGKNLSKEEIRLMETDEMIRVYTPVKDKTIRLGTYSRSDLITKFW